MRTAQKVIKILGVALALSLAVSIIVGLFSLAGLFTEDGVLEELKAYPISDEIRALDIEIGAADFIIREADSFLVESNLKNLTVKEENGTLKVKEQNTFGLSYQGASLVLTVPRGTVFDRISIKTGAGRLSAESLAAKSLSLELGAGEVIIDSLTATETADIDGGAGKMTVSGGELHNLDLDMGLGRMDLRAALYGNATLDLGVGESNLTLLGGKDPYTVAVERGIGNIMIDGQAVSDFSHTGNGQCRIDIHGGIGTIHLSFEDVGNG